MIQPGRQWACRALERLDALPDVIPLVAITLVAACLRLVRLDGTGLRIDEGFTLMVSRQPWPDVLGLNGRYDLHPPLYFAAAKAAAIVLPETVAARAVAAIAGLLTVPLLYLLGRRLVDGRVGLAAASLLAVSPLHVEISRDGRMYAPVILLVAASWLSLVLALQTPRPRWAISYALLVTAALYTDYSAGFAVVPQIGIIIWWARRSWGGGRWLVAAMVGAGVAYLPWLREVDRSIDAAQGWSTRANWLTASWANVAASLRSLAGLDGRTLAGSSDVPDIWSRWSWPHAAWVIVAVMAVVVGLAVVWRRPFALWVALGSAGGTVLAAIVLNRVSPGYAPRTVAASLLGAAILVSAFGTRQTLAASARLCGAVAWVALLAIACGSLPSTLEAGSRVEWPRVASDLVSQRGLGKPVILFSTAGMTTDLIDLYAGDDLLATTVVTLVDGDQELLMGFDRWVSRGQTLAHVRAGALERLLPRGDPSLDAVWVVLRFGGSPVLDELRRLGYRRIGSFRYVDTTTFLYARPDADLGETISVDPSFRRAIATGSSWVMPNSGVFVRLRDGGSGVPELVVARDDALAQLRFPVAGGGLVSIETQFLARESGAHLTVTCRGDDGTILLRRSFEFERIPPLAGWDVFRVAERCPPGTTLVEIAFAHNGEGEVAFRAVKVQYSQDMARS